MSIKSDRWIKRMALEHGMIEPFVETQARKGVVSFGLSDRYTWLEEDYPRSDGAPRRPLPFDDAMRPKPAFDAVHDVLSSAAPRQPMWIPPRC